MTSKIFRSTVFVAVVVLLCSLGIFSVDMRRFQTAPSLGFEWTDRRQNFPRKMYGNMDSPPGKRRGTPLTLSMGSVDGSFVFTDSLARHFPECLFYSPGAQIPQPAGHNGTCKPDGYCSCCHSGGDSNLRAVGTAFKQVPEHPGDGAHHCDVGCQGDPLADHISGNIRFTFFDCVNQSLVDHHTRLCLSFDNWFIVMLLE